MLHLGENVREFFMLDVASLTCTHFGNTLDLNHDTLVHVRVLAVSRVRERSLPLNHRNRGFTYRS
jgi:hypothetical protein